MCELDDSDASICKDKFRPNAYHSGVQSISISSVYSITLDNLIFMRPKSIHVLFNAHNVFVWYFASSNVNLKSYIIHDVAFSMHWGLTLTLSSIPSIYRKV